MINLIIIGYGSILINAEKQIVVHGIGVFVECVKGFEERKKWKLSKYGKIRFWGGSKWKL